MSREEHKNTLRQTAGEQVEVMGTQCWLPPVSPPPSARAELVSQLLRLKCPFPAESQQKRLLFLLLEVSTCTELLPDCAPPM